MARLTDVEVALVRDLDARPATVEQLVAWAAVTPAWRERYEAALAAQGVDPVGALAGVPSCPQVVGLDRRVVLRRAEWVDESLFLELVPAEEDPKVKVGFRLVGAEPRIWYLTGIQDVHMDTNGATVVMWVAMVHGDLVFTPGSY